MHASIYPSFCLIESQNINYQMTSLRHDDTAGCAMWSLRVRGGWHVCSINKLGIFSQSEMKTFPKDTQPRSVSVYPPPPPPWPPKKPPPPPPLWQLKQPSPLLAPWEDQWAPPGVRNSGRRECHRVVVPAENVLFTDRFVSCFLCVFRSSRFIAPNEMHVKVYTILST